MYLILAAMGFFQFRQHLRDDCFVLSTACVIRIRRRTGTIAWNEREQIALLADYSYQLLLIYYHIFGQIHATIILCNPCLIFFPRLKQ